MRTTSPSSASSDRQSSLLLLRREGAWFAVTALICAHFALIYDWSNRPFLNLPRYAAGLESSPFQERILMAWIFRASASQPIVAKVSAHLPEQLHNPYVFVQLLVSFAALLTSVAFTRGSFKLLTQSRSFSRWASLLVVFMAYFNLTLVYGPGFTLPYDVPGLFFFSACLYCIFRRSLPAFYLLFILGTLNRETSCFVTLLFVIWERTPSLQKPIATSWSAIAPHVLVQGLIWLAIKAYLAKRFSMNPQETGGAGLFVPHLRYNLHEILKPQQWPLLLSNFGFTLPLLINQREWIRQPAVSRMCAIVMPLWLLLMFYVGVIIEIRIFTELIALMAIAVGLILFHRFRNAER